MSLKCRLRSNFERTALKFAGSPLMYSEEHIFGIVRLTVVGPNKGTFKIREIGPNEGFFPKFGQFPYFEKFLTRTHHCIRMCFSKIYGENFISKIDVAEKLPKRKFFEIYKTTYFFNFLQRKKQKIFKVLEQRLTCQNCQLLLSTQNYAQWSYQKL